MPGEDGEAFVDVAIRLRVCLDRAWGRLMGLPPLALASMTVRSKANLLGDFWTEAVRADFADDPTGRFLEERGLRQLVTEAVRIRFKKVNRRLLVADNRTQQAASWRQLPIPGVTPLLSLTFGYRPDAVWSKIEQAGLALQVGKTVPWFLEVGPAADEDGAEPAPEPVDDRPIRVKRHVLETRQQEVFEGVGDATGEDGAA